MNNLPDDMLTDAGPGNGQRSTTGRGARRWYNQQNPRQDASTYAAHASGVRASGVSSLDGWSLFDSYVRRLFWPIFIAIAAAAAGAYYAWNNWSTTYTSTAQLVYRVPATGDTAYRPRNVELPTLAGLLRAPELMRRVGAQAQPALSPVEVSKRIRILPERDSAILTVTVDGSDLQETVALTNVFTTEAVRFTQEMQMREAAETIQAAQDRLAQVSQDITRVETRLASLPLNLVTTVSSSGTPQPVFNPAEQRLNAARDELAVLLGRYTDAHPLVREQRARISVLEQQLANSLPSLMPAVVDSSTLASNESGEIATLPATGNGFTRNPGDDIELLRHQARFLEDTRRTLMNMQRSATFVASNPPGYLDVLIAPVSESVAIQRPHLQIGAFAAFLGMLGFVATSALLIGRELMDNRIKSGNDLRRVAHLPLIATLGELRDMTDAQRSAWAFRAWTALQRRLSVAANQGIVAGFTSSSAGEGRSTWIKLMAQAATERGYRVLTISTQPGGPGSATDAEVVGASTIMVGDQTPVLTSSAIQSPQVIVDQLQRADAPPRIDLPLPGWVWSLERRKQWAAALNEWRKVDNLVILVELPPANVPEAVLLAENLPNVVWVSESGQADASETRQQIDTLRQARCNLVGGVLNRETAPPVRSRFTRWLGCGTVALLPLFVASPDLSAEPQAGPVTGGRLSVTSPAQRAEWQQRLTLGPGDVLAIGLFGTENIDRHEVAVGPDGTIGFLEARGVKAEGLTIDELREKLDQELSRTRRSPRTLISPVAYRSKNYIVLGKVARRGVFPLDRPITLVEAVARAGGFETGLRNGSIVESADFSRAFLARGNQRVPVDFERLFRSGDLSQNVTLAPGDYLFFPPAGLQEVYVLGEVRMPGVQDYISPQATTAVAAIAGRGGFTNDAYKRRVLVVRGSLQRPQTFTVDVGDVLSGRTRDLELQPRDIIYVSQRPWLRAEELLDALATSFVQAAVLTATGRHVGPFIR